MKVQQWLLQRSVVVAVIAMEHVGLPQCHREECPFHFRCAKRSLNYLLSQQQVQRTAMNEMGAELSLAYKVRSSHGRV
jgi:hypothetical protein